MSTNETFGMSCEKAICEYFNNDDYIDEKRIDRSIVNIMKSNLKIFFDENNIKELNYVGMKQNEVDFTDDDKKTYSVKSNISKSDKVCPQKIGQCTKNTFNEKVYQKNSKEVDPYYELSDEKIKDFILQNPHKLLVEYFNNLFCCDFMIYIKKTNKIDFDLISKKKLTYTKIKSYEITFTKNITNWNESNTMKIKLDDKPVSIGEFQIHKHRNCIKFRFHFKALLLLLQKIK